MWWWVRVLRLEHHVRHGQSHRLSSGGDGGGGGGGGGGGTGGGLGFFVWNNMFVMVCFTASLFVVMVVELVVG